MINYLIAALTGGLIGYMVKDEQEDKEKKGKKKPTYYVYINSEEMNDSHLIFYNYKEAKKMYEKVKKSGEIQVKDIVHYDKLWRDVYLKYKKEGEKPDHPLSYKDKIIVIEWGYGDQEFDKYEKN